VLVFSDLAPVTHLAAAKQAAVMPKLALPAEAVVRSVGLPPHFAAPRVALPETPLLAAPSPTEPVTIALSEAPLTIAPPAPRRGPDIELGSFSNPVVEKVALARVPAVTGVFAGSEKTAPRTAQSAVATGGFGEAAALRGDRQIVTTTNDAGFGDAAAGRTKRTAVGAGSASPGGFGDAVAKTGPAESKPIQEGGFQSAMAIEGPKSAGKAAAEEGNASAIAILDKPRPSYTEEARQLKIEGEVSLEVLFAASGRARVVRVLRGLGHGLDESAMRAAEAIRFRPAMREGAPVDATAVARITFQLAY
jgi:TonB family protein